MTYEILKRLEDSAGDRRKLKSELAEYICSLGINPTDEYVEVLEYLYIYRTHPTVEEIYDALLPADPSFSRSKIHSILDMLARAGAIKIIAIDKYNTHYDGDTTPHGHFICEKCGRVDDIKIAEDIFPALQQPQGAWVHDIQIMCLGQCKPCREVTLN